MQAETGPSGRMPRSQEKGQKRQNGCGGWSLVLSGDSPTFLHSNCFPQLPGQPSEQRAVGAAEMVALQAVGEHTNLFLG